MDIHVTFPLNMRVDATFDGAKSLEGAAPRVRMIERNLLLVLHVLGASVWVGRHLVLATTILPHALRDGDPARSAALALAFAVVGVSLRVGGF